MTGSDPNSSAPSLAGVLHGLAFSGGLYVGLVFTWVIALPFFWHRPTVCRITRGVSGLGLPFWLWLGGISLRVEGEPGLRGQDGPCIVIANHTSSLDPLVVMRAVGRTDLRWGAKASTLERPLLGRLLKACGWFGVDRSSPVALKRFQEHVKAEQKAGAVLRLGMFPEGTRSPDGEIQKFHLRPFLVAAELGLPIVPLVINGAYEAHPGGAFTVQPGSIQVRIEPTLVPPTRPRTPREMLAAAMELHRRAENIYRCARPATAEVPLALQENV